MKFICLLITFHSLNFHKEWDFNKFRSHFNFKYYRVSQINSIENDYFVKSKFSDGESTYDSVCKVTMSDGHIGYVKESCNSITKRVNELIE